MGDLINLPTDILKNIPLTVSSYHVMKNVCKSFRNLYDESPPFGALLWDVIKCDEVNLLKYFMGLVQFSNPMRSFGWIDLARIAVRYSSINIMAWISDKDHTIKDKWIITDYAAKAGNLPMLKWLEKNGFALSPHIGKMAAKKGDLNMLVWFEGNYLWIDWKNEAYRLAIKYGHSHILEFIDNLKY